MELAGRIALVTGSSAGIGRATAELMAERGARLVVHGRDEERTAKVAARTGGQAVVADLGTPAGVAQLVEQALAAYGAVDVLVVNAGRGWSGPFQSMPDEDLVDLVTVNELSPMLLVRRLLPDMVRRGAGHVVFVSSVAGRTGVAGEAVYAATKAALDALAESLRLELTGTGVSVSVVVPGAVDTGFFVTRGRPYDRKVPRAVAALDVAQAIVTAIERERAETSVPRWLGVVPVVRAVAPGPFRRLSRRFGEQVRSTATGDTEEPR